jgi:hypothetical protein
MGAAWYRLMSEQAPGYGFVAAGIPEIGMGVAEVEAPRIGWQFCALDRSPTD